MLGIWHYTLSTVIGILSSSVQSYLISGCTSLWSKGAPTALQFVINKLKQANGKCFSLTEYFSCIPLNTTSDIFCFSFKPLNKAKLKEFILISLRSRKRQFGIVISDLKYKASNK